MPEYHVIFCVSDYSEFLGRTKKPFDTAFISLHTQNRTDIKIILIFIIIALYATLISASHRFNFISCT